MNHRDGSFFALSGPDSDTYMWGSTEVIEYRAPSVRCCATCGIRSDPWAVRSTYRAKGRADLAFTYDGYAIASTRFRESVARAGLTGAVFDTLPASPAHAVLRSDVTIRYDAVRSGVQAERFCEGCSRFLEVVWGNPHLLETPRTDFSVTDVFFGSGNELWPAIIVSVRVRDVAEREGLRGPYFVPVATP